MPVVIKICGITNVPDALAAAEAGAEALGFMFYDKSPRCISLGAAAEIIRELPPSIVKVGVFVDAPVALVQRCIGECGLNLLQFHGTETPEYCRQFGLKCMKAFRVRDSASLEIISSYHTDAWLLDGHTPDKLGGTGEQFDWALAVQARALGRPIFLAGGLNAQNVEAAVRTVRPYGVDVSSGVETAPGKKDQQKVRAFVQAARAAG